MNILFLDCDGVINSENFLNEWISAHGMSDESLNEFKSRYFYHDGHRGYIVPELVEKFRMLCNKTNAKIVWSSSWRVQHENSDGTFRMNDIMEVWNAKSLPSEFLIGCTPVIAMHRHDYVPRYVEIKKWLDENSLKYNIGRTVILDDDTDAWNDALYRMNNVKFLNTSMFTGITDEIVNEAVEWLN